MKKYLAIILIICCATFIFGCTNNDEKEKIVSLVDENWNAYTEISISDENNAYEKGYIEKAYENGNKKVFLSLGKYGYNGDVEMVFLVEDNKIKSIETFSENETGGIGSRAFNESYLDQFIDINLETTDFLVGGSSPNENTDILYVTGATYSSSSIINTVNAIVYWYKSI